MIVLCASINDDASDVLQGTRLQNVPADSRLIVEMAGDPDNSRQAYFRCTIQLPTGEIPIDNQIIPNTPAYFDSSGAAASGEALILSNDSETMFEFPTGEGGKFILDFNAVTATGKTAHLTYRVTLLP